MDVEPNQIVVIDHGSSTCKVGFASDMLPRSIIPTCVALPKMKLEGTDQLYYYGEEALEKRGISRLAYPVEHGIITNWENMEGIWQYIFNQNLKINPLEHPVVLIEKCLTPKANRQKMMEVMFEKFKLRDLYLAKDAAMALVASGKSTGLVFDLGKGIGHISPVYETHVLSYAIPRYTSAGTDITDYMMKLLQGKGYNFTTTAERDVIRGMVEKLCYVALDYEIELQNPVSNITRTYKLPDNTEVTIDQERFKATEILFNSLINGLEEPGLCDMIEYTLSRSPPEIRETLLKNVVITGGNTLFPGFAERLQKELSARTNMPVSVTAPEDRLFSPWIGGSILGSLGTSEFMNWQVYEEYGPAEVDLLFF